MQVGATGGLAPRSLAQGAGRWEVFYMPHIRNLAEPLGEQTLAPSPPKCTSSALTGEIGSDSPPPSFATKQPHSGATPSEGLGEELNFSLRELFSNPGFNARGDGAATGVSFCPLRYTISDDGRIVSDVQYDAPMVRHARSSARSQD